MSDQTNSVTLWKYVKRKARAGINWCRYLSSTSRLAKYHLIRKAHRNDRIYRELPDRYPDKVFCIGANKTGTTSLKQALEDLGYTVGNQKEANIIALFVARGQFDLLINYCKSAQAFQDVPFSQGDVYKLLYSLYPDAKFILSRRSGGLELYKSAMRFMQSRLKRSHEFPTMGDIRKLRYVYKGYEWDRERYRLNLSRRGSIPYMDKDRIIRNYEQRNADIIKFFEEKGNLLVLDIADGDSYTKLCSFLEKKPIYSEMPHLNNSR